jgi:hypothetical protein
MQASKTLASSLLPKTLVPKRAEKGINITEMRLKMQNAFWDAVKDGRLEKALSEGKETPPSSAEKHIAFYRGSDWYHQHIEPSPGKKEAPKPASVDAAALEKARAKALNALVSAIQHGKLEMAVTEVVQEKKEMAFSTARDKLRMLLLMLWRMDASRERSARLSMKEHALGHATALPRPRFADVSKKQFCRSRKRNRPSKTCSCVRLHHPQSALRWHLHHLPGHLLFIDVSQGHAQWWQLQLQHPSRHHRLSPWHHLHHGHQQHRHVAVREKHVSQPLQVQWHRHPHLQRVGQQQVVQEHGQQTYFLHQSKPLQSSLARL